MRQICNLPPVSAASFLKYISETIYFLSNRIGGRIFIRRTSKFIAERDIEMSDKKTPLGQQP